MKKALLTLLLCGVLGSASATHFVGGYITYVCLGGTPTQYEVTMIIFRDCSPGTAGMPGSVTLALYNAQTGQQVTSYNINITNGPYPVPLTVYDPCTTPPSNICYEAATFTANITLPSGQAPQGYWLTYNSCCRNGTITNLNNPLGQGIKYYCRLADPVQYPCNNGPVFNNWPPIVVCINTPFVWNHSASDAEGDSLAYKFCNALNQGGLPPTPSVNYASGFTGANPITSAPQITIDPATGQISGTPTALGQYAINVCLEEWRNGVLIGEHHREIQLNVTNNCTNTSEAKIPTHTNHGGATVDSIFHCGGYTIQFGNTSISAKWFSWDFGDPTTTNDTSSQQYPSYTYPDTGTYLVRLITNPTTSCEDTAYAWVVVYPYTLANFGWSGTNCQYNPMQFLDSSINYVGTITSYRWDFGDGTASSLQDPIHVFTGSGVFWVKLVITNSIGCQDSIFKPVFIYPSPALNAGPDKTICVGDTHQFNAAGSGVWSWSPGTSLSDTTISNPVSTPLVSMSYTVTLTGTNGCKNRDTVNVFLADYPVVNAGPDFTICNNNIGWMAAAASDTSGTLTYAWSPWLSPGGLTPPVQFATIPPNTCKDYQFSATNKYGCKSIDSITVCRNVISVSLGPDVTICRGTGHQMNPVSANGLQTYSWSPGSGLSATNTPDPLASPIVTLTYTLMVTDTAGCIGSDVIKINVIPSPTVDAGTRDSICAGKTIQLNASASTGVTYLWDNSDNDVSPVNVRNPVVSPSASKYYHITVNASNGCKATDSVWIGVLPLPPVKTSDDFSICASDSIQMITTGASSYTWLPIGQPGFSCTFCPNPWFYAGASGVGQGPRSYIVQGVDIYGCVSRDTVTVTVNALPPISAGPDVFICTSDTTTLTANGAGPGGNYVWTNSTSLSCTNCTSPLAFPPVTETFEVTGIDSNGCRNTDKVKVSVFTAQSIFVTTGRVCIGDTVQLTAYHPNAQSYAWTPSSSLTVSTGGSVGAFPTSTTTYTVIVTDNNGCQQQTTVIVPVDPLPNVFANPTDVTICEKDTTQLDAGGAVSYSWSPVMGLSNPNVRNPKASPGASTVYVVTGTDVNGCRNTASVNMTVNPLPPIDAGPDIAICFGDTAQLWSDGAGPSGTYYWTPAVNFVSPQSNQYPFVYPQGSQTYMVQGTDLNGCKSTDAVQVIVNPLPPIDLEDDKAICIGGNTTITVTGAGASGTYSWAPPVGINPTTGPTVTADPVTTTTYTVLGTDANGCQNTDSMVLTVNSLPLVNAGIDVTICDEDQTLLSASGAINYSWAPTSYLSNPTIPNPYASPPVTITYIVTGINGDGCENSDTITVFVNPLPSVDAGIDVTICFGDEAQLLAAGADTYVWTPTTGLSCTNCDGPIASPTTTQTYAVTGTDLNGCKKTDNMVVTVNPLPPVNAGQDFTMYKGTCTDLQALGAISYVWSPSLYLSNPAIAAPTVCPTEIDTITYYVIGTDARGCQKTDSITVRIIGTPEVSVPTGFTPNGDGMNDEFRIVKSHNFHMEKLQVFNRWGQVVFETNDINKGWNGTSSGAVQPIGAYVYVIHGVDEYGAPVLTEGNVTLIR